LEVETDFTKYNMIILTGGEPMLEPGFVIQVIDEIRDQNIDVPIIMYTAKCSVTDLGTVLMHRRYSETGLNGLTVTLHNNADVKPFNEFNFWFNLSRRLLDWSEFSLRLNVFREVDINKVNSSGWNVKQDIVWIENCPLPQNEVFKKHRRLK
jgi:hypothetical protein